MKFHKLILLLLIPFILCSCEKIDISNAHELDFIHKYSKVTLFGNQKEINKTYTVTQACDFVNKYLPLLYSRSYLSVTGEEEKILYSESFKREEDYEQSVKSYYTGASAETEVTSIRPKHVIMIGGDAYVNAAATVTLTACESDIAAKSIGFENGIGSSMPCEFNLKLKYENKEYKVYDMEWVEKEGNLLPFKNYVSADAYNTDEAQIINSLTASSGITNDGEITENSEKDLTDEVRIGELKKFINNLASRQQNRSYKTLKGNEDYEFLSDEYIAEVNAERDDMAYTRKIYNDLKLATKLIATDIKNIEIKKDCFVVTVDITSQIKECISESRAIEIGYTGGIGSNGVMSFIYTVKEIDGSFKIADSIQTK